MIAPLEAVNQNRPKLVLPEKQAPLSVRTGIEKQKRIPYTNRALRSQEILVSPAQLSDRQEHRGQVTTSRDGMIEAHKACS